MSEACLKSSRTYVLVHGAHQGGWCFDRVARILRKNGNRVFTPTLAGLAERFGDVGSAINLTTHIAEVVTLLRSEELKDVVLCGHSYGGMVVGGVADAVPDVIDHLVFLDAIVPEDGKSVADYMFRGESLAALIEIVGQEGGGFLVPAPPAAVFNVNEVDRAMVDHLSTAHPFASLIEKIRLQGNSKKIAHHSYIFASDWDFAPIAEHYDRAKAQPGWRTYEVKAGHDIMLDAPEQLAEILNNLD